MHGAVPSRITIFRWKKKEQGPNRTVRPPENIERAREAVVRSPIRSARKHAIEININRESFRKFLLKDLKFADYPKINRKKFEQREDFAKKMKVSLKYNLG